MQTLVIKLCNYGTAREQVYIKMRSLARAHAEFLRVLASYLRVLARASQSFYSRVTYVCTTIARVRNTRECLSMYVRNTSPIARQQCKYVHNVDPPPIMGLTLGNTIDLPVSTSL